MKEIKKEKFPTIKKRVPIDWVFPNLYNPNIQTKEMFEKGKKSVEELGFLMPVLVREKEIRDEQGNLVGDELYEIIDGEHRWRYCKELNYKEIDIESMGKISDQVAKFLTIQLNNLRGKDDVLKRAELLKQLNEGQLSLLPFDNKQIEEELKLLDFDFSQYENVELPNEEIQALCVPLKKMEEIMIILNRINNDTRIKELNHLIIQYNNVLIAFRKIIENKKLQICK